MKLAGYDTAATVTIKKAANMTPKGRKKIAEWLREKAEDLVTEGPNYTARFTARYWYRVGKTL